MSGAPRDPLRTACITVAGAGFLRPASGTWGSLFALIPFVPIWLIVSATTAPRAIVELALVAGIALASVLSVRWGPWAIQRFGRKDPKQFVLDEFAGQWVALLILPVSLAATPYAVACVIASQFLLFRIMDILKPPPARQLERLPAGWGVLIDDLFAGAYANIVGQLLWRLTPLAAWLGIRLSEGS